LVLHAVNSILVYSVILALVGRVVGDQPEHRWSYILGAAVAAATFSVHPLRTEVVAWVSSQSYLPCVMFCLLAILLYLRAHPRHGVVDRLAFCASFVCFVVALLFKAPAVTLPLLLLLIDAYPLRRRDIRRIWLEKIPHFGVSLIFIVLAILSKPHAPIVASAPLGSLVGRIAHSAYGIGFYLTRTIWPYPLTAFYGASPGTRPWNWPFVASFVAAVTITVIAVRLRKSNPSLLAAWAAFVTVLSPNLGFVQISSQLAADRYSYLAMIGPMTLVGGSLGALFARIRWTRFRALTAGTAAASIIAGQVVLTRAQCETWRSSEALWTHALNHGGEEVPDVRNSVGLSLVELGRLEEAKEHFVAASLLRPSWGDPHNNLGVLFARENNYEDARRHFTEAIRLDPKASKAHENLGRILLRDGKVGAAVHEFTLALIGDPDGLAGLRSLEDLLLIRRSALEPTLVPLIQAVIAGPRQAEALRALEAATKADQ
jgi:tetratricopeptide (TPR) repeat protein